jgi:hypothetical protein
LTFQESLASESALIAQHYARFGPFLRNF